MPGKKKKDSKNRSSSQKPTASSTHDQPEDTHDVGASAEEQGTVQQQSGAFTTEQDDLIAKFFEENPFYYDRQQVDYKDKKKRDAKLYTFAESLGFTTGKCF